MYNFIELLKTTKRIYLVFYFSFFVLMIVASFFDKEILVYFKPLIPLTVAIIYIKSTNKINYFYLISLLFLTLGNIFIYNDFLKYFDLSCLFIIVFYFFNFLTLKPYWVLSDIKLSHLNSFPVIISFILIGYLTYSISSLIFPIIQNSILISATIFISFISFATICLFIYMADRYFGNFRLLVVSSCCLFVSALLPINEFYYYNRAFTIVINIADTLWMYFFLRFLIDVKINEPKHEIEKYF